MKINDNILTAEEGKAIHRIGEASPTTITRVALPASDSPDNWEDCEYGEPGKIKYYAVDLLSAIGEVAGEDRYDDIKATLSATRMKGVPVWDMLISGMYIPAEDSRIQTIKKILIDAELLTDEEFDRILVIARSEENQEQEN